MPSNGDKAWIPSWAIKLIAAAFLAATIAWAGNQTNTNTKQSVEIGEIKTESRERAKQLDRIETKLDRLIEKEKP